MAQRASSAASSPPRLARTLALPGWGLGWYLAGMRLAALLPLALLAAGCASGPDLSGTWDISNVTGSQLMPPGAKMEVAFTKPAKAVVVNTMTAPVPGQTATITATIECDYKLEGSKLTLTGKDAKIEATGLSGPMKAMFDEQIANGKKRMLEEINKAGVSEIAWEGNDKFTAKSATVSMTFTRRKSG